MRQREVQRRCLERYVVFCAQGRNLLRLRGNRRRYRPVFEVVAASEHAGAIRAANYDIHFLALRGRHQTLKCHLMVEEGISASQQGGVRIRLSETEQKLYRFDLTCAEAPAFDHALVAQFREGSEGPVRAVSNIAS